MKRRTLILVILLLDLMLLNLALVIMSEWHYHRSLVFNDLVILLNINWLLLFVYTFNDNFFIAVDFITGIRNLIRITTFYVLAGSFLIVFLNMDNISRTMFIGSSIVFFTLKVFFLYPYNYIISRRKDGTYYNKILVVGTGRVAEAIQTYYKLHPDLGRVIGFLGEGETVSKRFNVLGRLADFQKVFEKTPFNETIITLPLAKEEEIKALVEIAEYNGVRPGVVANYYSLFDRNFEMTDMAGIPIVNVRELPLNSYIQRVKKRTFDVIFSLAALIFLFPVFLIIALAIKLNSKGPVFYKPVRIGKRGERISVFKFRSMRHSVGPASTMSTKLNDDRITRVGKFIRKYSLDELPQFINVLIGEMSVVGPRPHRIDLNTRFQQNTHSYNVRQYIKPGITGWAQVHGWRGPTETKFQYVARTLHDLWYIEHWTFLLDIYIIYLTIFGKKARKNAF